MKKEIENALLFSVLATSIFLLSVLVLAIKCKNFSNELAADINGFINNQYFLDILLVLSFLIFIVGIGVSALGDLHKGGK